MRVYETTLNPDGGFHSEQMEAIAKLAEKAMGCRIAPRRGVEYGAAHGTGSAISDAASRGIRGAVGAGRLAEAPGAAEAARVRTTKAASAAAEKAAQPPRRLPEGDQH